MVHSPTVSSRHRHRPRRLLPVVDRSEGDATDEAPDLGHYCNAYPMTSSCINLTFLFMPARLCQFAWRLTFETAETRSYYYWLRIAVIDDESL